MAHSWCEATLDDIGGLYKRQNTMDGRFVFDFTKTKGQLFFQSVFVHNLLCKIPLVNHDFEWDGNEHHYHRFEYNPEEAKAIILKNIGTWKFYEFDADAIDAELRNIQVVGVPHLKWGSTRRNNAVEGEVNDYRLAGGCVLQCSQPLANFNS